MIETKQWKGNKDRTNWEKKTQYRMVGRKKEKDRIKQKEMRLHSDKKRYKIFSLLYLSWPYAQIQTHTYTYMRLLTVPEETASNMSVCCSGNSQQRMASVRGARK